MYQEDSLPIILHLSNQIDIYRGDFFNSIHEVLVMTIDITSFLQNVGQKTPSNEAAILGKTEKDAFENWAYLEDRDFWPHW